MTTMPPTSNTVHAYRGRVLHFLHDPQYRERDAYEYWEDGLLVVLGGKVIKAGDYAALREDLPAGAQLHDYSGKLIVPGFIDTHIHFPQTDIIASPSPGLLHWLETYTFPEERRFESEQYAAGVASFFLDELLRNGTTSAMVWSTVHRGSAETLFTQAQQRGMRMITGKVMMDRNCPEYLRDTAESGARDTADLISRWHGKDRLAYAITPRFAPTSSEAQLQACAELAKNRGIIASFSRALLNDLRHQMSDDELNASLGEAIDEIYAASATKTPVAAGRIWTAPGRGKVPPAPPSS